MKNIREERNQNEKYGEEWARVSHCDPLDDVTRRLNRKPINGCGFLRLI